MRENSREQAFLNVPRFGNILDDVPVKFPLILRMFRTL
jgi:hypothetical protein